MPAKPALFILAASLVSGGCGGIPIPPNVSPSDGIVVMEVDSSVADRKFLIDAARTFYSNHPDDIDMLVIWGSRALAPGHSSYLPVRNDVSGIGYQHVGPEFFDDSTEFGSQRLEGVIWMGPEWLDIIAQEGESGVLGVLAHETAHRWGSTIRFSSPELKSPSEALLGSPFHWSFFLDTGTSPLGGNNWVPLDNDTFRAEPDGAVAFAPIDLYLMGLLPAEEVPPLRMLVNVRSSDSTMGAGFGAFWPRVTHPLEVRADVAEVSIDQVIEAEGPRNSDSGFTAAMIRQAWIFVVQEGEALLSEDEPAMLDGLRLRWADFWQSATNGLGAVDTTLNSSPAR